MIESSLDKKIRLITMLCFLGITSYVVMRFPGCGIQDPIKEDAPLAPVPCGELKLGQTRTSECPEGGKKIEACNEGGLSVAQDCEKPKGNECGKTTFTEVKPILTQRCAACHAGYDQFVNAKAKGAEFVRRVNLPGNNSQRMPKAPSPELTPDQKDLFNRWKLDGFLEKCGAVRAEIPHYNLDDIEAAMVNYTNAIKNEDRRLKSRFLVMTHKIDQKVPEADLALFSAGTNKAINSLNDRGKFLKKLVTLGPEQSIFYINLEDFDFSVKDWEKIIAADKLKIESFTNQGKMLKFLTQTARPWMHFDNFIDTTMRNSKLYYDLLGVPETFLQLTQKLGVNFAGDLAGFQASLIGEFKSPISLEKNRLISRHRSLDGYFWTTFDPIDPEGVPQRNLAQFPLLKETGGKRIFEFVASEVIFSLPNGLQGYGLFNNKGVRQDAAPLNVVADRNNPITPEIRNANSCHRCHDSGLIAVTDQIRNHVIKNASEFGADKDIILALYKDASFNSKLFETDKAIFLGAISKIEVATGVDPINYATDHLLLSWDLQQAAAFFFLRPEEFAEALNSSAVARVQIGPLLSGSTVTFNQIVDVLPQLVKDLRLFQEPLGE